MRLERILAACVFSIIVASCASSHIMIGQARPAIPVDQVKLYLRPPAKYQEIAIIDASSRGAFAFSDQSKMDKAVQRLRVEAASLGANGILLEGAGEQFGGTVNSGNATATTVNGTTNAYGSGVAVPVILKVANGVAIYVESE